MRKHGKKLLSLLLALVLVLVLLPAQGFAATSGTCGDNAAWSLENGVLTISGTGAMTDNLTEDGPWSNQLTAITSVVIGSGITRIGDFAFRNCENLTSVVIPDSVTEIGRYAFGWCVSLTSVSIGNGVTSIGDGAFFDCTGLTSIVISDSVTSIDDNAFSLCENLTSIVIPASVTSIGDSAFFGCRLTLKDVYYGGSEAQWGVVLGDFKDDLSNATIHYNSASTSVPSTPEQPSAPEQPSIPDVPEMVVPDLQESSIQDAVIESGTDGAPEWVDRLGLPEYGETLYDTISGAGGGKSVFEAEANFTLPSASTGPEVSQVDKIEAAEFDLLDMYADPGAELNSAIFSNESFYDVAANAEDRKIDFQKLEIGDLVTTANFNGVYVTKIPYDAAFDTKKTETCSYIAAVYHAFDRDNPDIFWLSGKSKARIMVAADAKTGTKEAYFFLELADKDGFTMRAPAWTASGSIEAGIKRRDAAEEKILAAVTAGDTQGKLKQLNKWLTENNQYNTTADLTTISNEPHECLAALEGRTGTDGPVCDGYSRAFKVLCDRLNIPCVLETGWARSAPDSTPGLHMWNLVQLNNTWYAADITWDDPSVKGSVGAKSGRENEKYLLVGAETIIDGMTFGQSHMVKNQAAVGGVDFNNGPVLSANSFMGALPTVESIPATGTVYARTQAVKLDGRDVEFQCYAVKNAAGNETNYVKLRDLAQALNGTRAQFNVTWDGQIGIAPSTAYQAVGGEGTTPYSGDQPYKAVSSTPVSFNGSSVNLTSFSITYQGGGYTYYKLRDLGQLLGFNVKWDGGVVIETDKPYTGT